MAAPFSSGVVRWPVEKKDGNWKQIEAELKKIYPRIHLLKSPVCHMLACLSLHTSSVTSIRVTEHLQKTKVSLASNVVNKKLRKLEKAMKQLERKGQRILKPVEENEVSVQLGREIKSGLRQREPYKYTSEELEERVLLEKEWARYKMKQHLADMKVCRKLRLSQEKALSELRKESEELYQQAIQVDESLLPFTFKGPVNTPPIPGYYAQDGSYVDKTNYFEDSIDILTEDVLTTKKRKR